MRGPGKVQAKISFGDDGCFDTELWFVRSSITSFAAVHSRGNAHASVQFALCPGRKQ
jgi:hypothetical protein